MADQNEPADLREAGIQYNLLRKLYFSKIESEEEKLAFADVLSETFKDDFLDVIEDLYPEDMDQYRDDVKQLIQELSDRIIVKQIESADDLDFEANELCDRIIDLGFSADSLEVKEALARSIKTVNDTLIDSFSLTYIDEIGELNKVLEESKSTY